MIYDPTGDALFKDPYIDREGWEEAETAFYYVHGGFAGTQVRFSFYYPAKEQYGGRFYHYVAPAPGGEEASYHMTGAANKVRFAHEHGAYFVESNMGANIADPPLMIKASAAAAMYSRTVACRLYGEHRPYGYLYGGSGGAYKTIGCFESTRGVWDGAVPYVVGTPMSIPYNMTIRAHALRVLGDKTEQIADAVDAGGSGAIFDGLNAEEQEALAEATALGFPLQAWFAKEFTGLGSLPVLAFSTQQADPGYYEDFWKLPGYLGAEPQGSAARARVRIQTRLTHITVPPRAAHNKAMDEMTGVDTNWLRMLLLDGAAFDPWVEVGEAPDENAFLDGLYMTILTGKMAGSRVLVKAVEGQRITLGQEFGAASVMDVVEGLQAGDEVLLDNSTYLAMQTYHRHQVPKEGYPFWNFLRQADGTPRYPQRELLYGPLLARGGGGGHLQDGHFEGKMISVCALWDESAFPVNGDWYRQAVRAAHGGDEQGCYRIYWCDHALHDDGAETPKPLQLCGYQGVLHQALIDLANWVEKGVEPVASTAYWFENSQIQVPPTAAERKGLQPVVTLTANGHSRAEVRVGETVTLEALVEVPENAGTILSLRWSLDGDESYPAQESIRPGQTRVQATKSRTFDAPGTYFVSVLAASSRSGDAGDIFTHMKNIGRARIVVRA